MRYPVRIEGTLLELPTRSVTEDLENQLGRYHCAISYRNESLEARQWITKLLGRRHLRPRRAARLLELRERYHSGKPDLIVWSADLVVDALQPDEAVKLAVEAFEAALAAKDEPILYIAGTSVIVRRFFGFAIRESSFGSGPNKSR